MNGKEFDEFDEFLYRLTFAFASGFLVGMALTILVIMIMIDGGCLT